MIASSVLQQIGEVLRAQCENFIVEMTSTLCLSSAVNASRSGRGKKRSAEGDGSATKAPANDKAAANDTLAAAKDPQAKGKRKYVKSGKFVGKFNSYQKQREGKSNDEGRAGSKRSRKKTAGRVTFIPAI